MIDLAAVRPPRSGLAPDDSRRAPTADSLPSVPDQPPPFVRSTRFARLVHVTRCTSTQDLALAAGESGCAVYWADHQTAGRGRQGRAWDDAEAEDLAVTFRLDGITLPHPVRLPAAVSLAVLTVLEPICGRRLQVKWPNDVLVDGLKIAGVLVDGTNQPAVFAVGVGINVNRTRFPAELADTATSLALLTGHTVDRGELLDGLAAAVDATVDALLRDDVGAMRELYRDRIDLVDRAVQITSGGQVSEGRVREIDLDEVTLQDGRRFALAGVQALRRG